MDKRTGSNQIQSRTRWHMDTDTSQETLQEQPYILAELLRQLSAARRQSSLYGSDHPSSLGMFAALADLMLESMESLGPVTCVFSKKTVVVNDRCYRSSVESEEMLERLRARGVMAVTISSPPPIEQIQEFLAFLNADPREVRQGGGPAIFLRRHGVTRIVATEAVYTTGEESEPGGGLETEQEWDEAGLDRAVAAAVDWLVRQDETQDDEVESTALPIGEILARPDAAARLIHEAVTKLHRSRKGTARSEIAGEVVQELRDLAVSDGEEWEKCTPQVRRAIGKLPPEMRPLATGFADNREDSTLADKPSMDPDRAETLVQQAFADAPLQGPTETGDTTSLDQLFGTRVTGLLPGWRSELAPATVVRSCGGTLATLLQWETSPLEHGRIARALAALIPRAADADDSESATWLAATIAAEARTEHSEPWRGVNAAAALKSIDPETLAEIVREAATSGRRDAEESAAHVIEAVPALSPTLMSLVGLRLPEIVESALTSAAAQSETTAVPALGQMLRDGAPNVRDGALEVLVGIGTYSAIREVASSLDAAQPAFAIVILNALRRAKVAPAKEACHKCLTHRSPDVRCTALSVLGSLDDGGSVQQMLRVASRRDLSGKREGERLAGIEAIGECGSLDTIESLHDLVRRRPLLRRRNYETMQTAVERAITRIRQRCEPAHSDIAA